MRGIEQAKMGSVLSSGLIHCSPPILQSPIVLVTHIDIVTRAALMRTINDFLAYGIVFGWSMHVKLKNSYYMETVTHQKLVIVHFSLTQSLLLVLRLVTHQKPAPCFYGYRTKL